MDYPSNSNHDHESEENPRRVEKVIEGTATVRKKTLGRKFSEVFFGGDDARSVWSYVMFDVMVPAAKDMIVDAGSEALQRSFYGTSRPSRRPSRGGARPSKTSYNKMYQEEERRPASMSRRARSQFDFDEIAMETRAEGLEVLDNLYTLVSQYGSATVAEFYELAGISANYTDQKYGWTDLRGSDVIKTRDGYVVDLPKPKPLDK